MGDVKNNCQNEKTYEPGGACIVRRKRSFLLLLLLNTPSSLRKFPTI